MDAANESYNEDAAEAQSGKRCWQWKQKHAEAYFVDGIARTW